MKICLFAVALAFASLFVMSGLVGFVWGMVDLLNETGGDFINMKTHLYTVVGLAGWIASSLALVYVDESDYTHIEEN